MKRVSLSDYGVFLLVSQRCKVFFFNEQCVVVGQKGIQQSMIEIVDSEEQTIKSIIHSHRVCQLSLTRKCTSCKKQFQIKREKVLQQWVLFDWISSFEKGKKQVVKKKKSLIKMYLKEIEIED